MVFFSQCFGNCSDYVTVSQRKSVELTCINVCLVGVPVVTVRVGAKLTINFSSLLFLMSFVN